MKMKKLLTTLLAVLMVVAMMPVVAFAADGSVSVSIGDKPYDTIEAALAEAEAGDTITLGAGTYSGDIVLNKAVSLAGAGIDSTTVVGNIRYDNVNSEAKLDIDVKGLTVKAPEGNTVQQAIHWANHGTLKNAALSVSDVKVVDYQFAVGVNSSASDCTLTASNLVLENVWCGLSLAEGQGNTLKAFDVAEGSTVDYEVQIFNLNSDRGYGYYKDADVAIADTIGAQKADIDNSAQPDVSGGAWPPVVDVDSKYYFATLQEAVDKAEELEGANTINIHQDIVLTDAVDVDEDELTINGNGNKITVPALGAFSESTSVYGLKDATKLYINDVKFAGPAAGSQTSYAVVIGNGDGVEVGFTGCTFTDMYTAVYANPVLSADSEGINVIISYCTYDNVAYAYSVDNGSNALGEIRADKHNFTLDESKGYDEEKEDFAIAVVDGVGYGTTLAANTAADRTAALEAALAAAAAVDDKTVTLMQDVELAHMLTINQEGVTVNLDGHKISAADGFSGTGNAAHLVDITADGVTLTNGTLEAGAANNHTLNIWNADGVNISDLKLDGSKAGVGGAPLIVGASHVTASGDIKAITGKNSWYAINVDSRNVSGNPTAGSLNLENADMVFAGTNPLGIYIQNEADAEEGSKLTFGENVTVTSEIENFVVVAIQEKADGPINGSVENFENAGLETDEDGNIVLHQHKFTAVEAIAAACDKAGNIAYWYCESCEKYFADKDGTVEIDLADTVIPALDHEYKDGKCIRCGEADPNYVPDDDQKDPATGDDNKGDTDAGKDPVKEPAEGAPEKTGDANDIVLWLALMALTAAALAGTAAYSRKRG